MDAWRHIPMDTHDAITSLLRQNDFAVPFEWNNDVIVYVLGTLGYWILYPVYESPIFNGATGCDYLSMSGLMLIHVNKTGPWRSSEDIMAWTSNHILHNSVMCNYLFIPLSYMVAWRHIPTDIHGEIITSLLRQNDIAASLWRHDRTAILMHMDDL